MVFVAFPVVAGLELQDDLFQRLDTLDGCVETGLLDLSDVLPFIGGPSPACRISFVVRSHPHHKSLVYSSFQHWQEPPWHPPQWTSLQPGSMQILSASRPCLGQAAAWSMISIFSSRSALVAMLTSSSGVPSSLHTRRPTTPPRRRHRPCPCIPRRDRCGSAGRSRTPPGSSCSARSSPEDQDILSSSR